MEMTTDQRRALDRAMSRPWVPKIVASGEGFRLTIPEIADFEVFAAKMAELEDEWRDLLESHLMAYVRTGKTIPPTMPWIDVSFFEGVNTANSVLAPMRVVFMTDGLNVTKVEDSEAIAA